MDKTKLKRSLATSLQASDLLGSWSNELGSVMMIEAASQATFSGKYVSAVSADGTSTTGVLSGTVAQDTIAFNVNWQPNYNSVTSWTGLVLTDGTGPQVIYALWQLAAGADAEKDWWAAVSAGADLFVRGSSRPSEPAATGETTAAP